MGKDLCLDLDCVKYRKASRKEVAIATETSDDEAEMVIERGKETITKQM